MYKVIKNLALKFFKVPPEPEDPMGNVKTLRVFRAAYNYFRYKLLKWAVTTFFSAVVTVVAAVFVFYEMCSKASTSYFIMIFASVIVILLISTWIIKTFIGYVILRLDYEMRWYKVSDRSLRIREGVTKVREFTMTFANIQNISIEQGPLQRIFGISDLKVESAGGETRVNPKQKSPGAITQDNHTAYFRGVENAEEIKALIRERLKRYKSSGLGDPDDINEDESASPPIEENTEISFQTSILERIKLQSSLFRKEVEKISL